MHLIDIFQTITGSGAGHEAASDHVEVKPRAMLRNVADVIVLLMLLFGYTAEGRAQTAMLGGQSSSLSSYIIGNDGRLYSWGFGIFGQLGHGDQVNRSSPQQIGFPTGVTAWTMISGGLYHGLAVGNDGRLYSWGYNASGELGLGHMTDRSTPQPVGFPTGVTSWNAISAGSNQSFAVGNNGRLYSWGSNGNGELGLGHTTNQASPQPVSFPAGVTSWSRVASGSAHTLAIGSDGRLYGWGLNTHGTLGLGHTTNHTTPQQVSFPAGVTSWGSVACGTYSSYAIGNNGRLYSWGFNQNGQLGLGHTTTQWIPQQVGLPTGVASWTAVAAGGIHGLGLGNNGRLYSWGYNGSGSLGIGNTTDRLAPWLVDFPTGVGSWTGIAGGNTHSLGVADNGRLYAWGGNQYSQVGDTTTTQRNSPVLVGTFGGTAPVAASDSICFTPSTSTPADIAGANVAVEAGVDDGVSSLLEIGFTYRLDSINYTNFSVSSNGLMKLGAGVVTSDAKNGVTTSTAFPLLVPFWDDLYTANSGVTYRVNGASPNRTLVVQWQAYRYSSNASTYTGNPHYTFQVHLHEGTNRFEYVYGAMDSTGNSTASIGWQKAATKFFSITPARPATGSRTVSNHNVNLHVAAGFTSILPGTSYNFDPACAPVNNNSGTIWTRLQLGATIDLSGAWFLTSLEGFVVGTGGRMYRTTDGGITWTLVITGTTVNLTGIRVIGSYWYIYGSGGLVRYSNNGGVTWITITLNTTETIYSISFINANYGFAVGSGGTIFFWNGTTWIRQTINVNITFRSVYVIGSYAYAVGDGGVIYRYNGTTWVRIDINITTAIYDVQFFDDGFGYFVGAGGVICRTTNGGLTWTPLTSGITLNIRSIRIVSRTIAFAVGDGGLLLQTVDGGLTWVRIDLGTTINLTSVIFVDGVGYVFGAGGTVFTFRSSFVTIYAGTSFTRLFLNTTVRLNRTVFVSRLVGYVVGNGGTLLRTIDGGATWVTINIGITIDLTSIRVIGGVIYITGANGYIGYSIDGGTTWIRYTINSTATFHNIYFFNRSYGFAVGSGGEIWLFNGTVWLRQTINTTATFYSVYGVGKYIYACGSGGALWRYDGATWIRINIGVTIDLLDIHFYDGRFGYIACAGGKLYRTIDGGLTWTLQTTGVTVNIRSIRSASRLIAWASCDGGIVLQTVDGGITWTQVSLGAQYDLTSLDYADGAGYIVGSGGIAYSFTTTHLRFAVGLHFTRLNIGTTRQVRGASFIDRYIGFIVGQGGMLRSTLDGGLTWNNLQLGTTVNLNRIRMIGNVGFIVGDSGHICRSLDRGATWRRFALESTAHIYAISLVNASHGFAVGSGGSIFRFNGTTWVRENISVTASFYGVYTFGNTCYAVGQGGIIHRWNGTAWIALSSGVNVDIYDIAFHDVNFGYFVGAGGTLCRTIDGGTSWSRIDIGITANIRSIKVHSREIAWAVCDGGIVLQTLDGGLTWGSISIGTDDILSIDFIDGTGWVFGSSGLAYSFTSDNVGSGSFTFNRLNRALCLNGSSSWVDVTNSAQPQPGRDLTLSAWIRPSAFTDTAGIIGNYRRQNGEGSGYGLLIKSDGRIGLAVVKNNGITHWIWSDNPVVLDRWTHIAGTYDGTTMKLYLDGREAASFTNTMLEFQVIRDNTMAIGRYFGSGPGFFNGCIDEVALWGVPCPASHIRRMMHLRLAGNEKGLISVWHLDDADGALVRDAVSGSTGIAIDIVRSISTVRIGIGRSWTWNITGNGWRYFNGTDLSIGFANRIGINDVLVSSVLDIEGLELPAGIGRVLPRWWTIRGYGSGTFDASLRFYLGPRTIGAGDSANPANLRLFCRGANGYGAWRQVGTVTAIDRKTGEVTFGGLTGGGGPNGIGSDYGEFIIGTTGDSDLDPSTGVEIIESPLPAAVCIGDSTTLAVTPRGGNMTYQWRRNGVDIVGANERILSIPQAAVANNGSYDVVVNGQSAPEAISDVAELSVDPVPAIILQPVAPATCLGSSATFSVTTGGGRLRYQWRRNGVEISGAVDSIYTIHGAAAGDEGIYDLVITGNCGVSITSAPTRFTITREPVLFKWTESQTIAPGNPVTFSILAVGNAMSYQWWKGNMPIAGATASSYSIAAVTKGDAGIYSVQVSNGCSITSQTSGGIFLFVGDGTSAGAMPTDQSVCLGQTATFTAPGTVRDYEYQWRLNSVDIVGATFSTLEIARTKRADDGLYTVKITDRATGGIMVTVPARLMVSAGVTIISQPAGAEVCEGAPVVLSAEAEGIGLRYQWRRNGVWIPGATAATLELQRTGSLDAGRYDVVIGSDCGEPLVTSVADVIVKSPAAITRQPVGRSVARGASVSFAVRADGSAVGYQWRRNGVEIAGATSEVITISSARIEDAGRYDVMVTSRCGESRMSDPAMLEVQSTSSVLGSSRIANGAGMLVTPHPARGMTRLRITLPEGIFADVQSTLGLYDPKGNHVLDLSASFVRGAFTTVEFDAGTLAAGHYSCRLETRRWSGSIGSFVVVR